MLKKTLLTVKCICGICRPLIRRSCQVKWGCHELCDDGGHPDVSDMDKMGCGRGFYGNVRNGEREFTECTVAFQFLAEVAGFCSEGISVLTVAMQA